MKTIVRTNLIVTTGLLVLLGAAVLNWRLDLGAAGTAIGLSVAALKALLIAIFFMELRESSPLTRLFAAAGVYWLILLFALTLTDVLFR